MSFILTSFARSNCHCAAATLLIVGFNGRGGGAGEGLGGAVDIDSLYHSVCPPEFKSERLHHPPQRLQVWTYFTSHKDEIARLGPTFLSLTPGDDCAKVVSHSNEHLKTGSSLSVAASFSDPVACARRETSSLPLPNTFLENVWTRGHLCVWNGGLSPRRDLQRRITVPSLSEGLEHSWTAPPAWCAWPRISPWSVPSASRAAFPKTPLCLEDKNRLDPPLCSRTWAHQEDM